MTRLGIALTLGLVAAAGLRGGAAGGAVDDDFTIRGCVTSATAPNVVTPSSFFWSRSDIMLAAAEAPPATPMTGRVFYWLDTKDQEDLVKYRGQRVEIKGELEDIEKAKVKVEREDGFVKVKLDLDGKDQEARVPADWLASWKGDKDEKYDIAVRKIDINKVKVLGACGS